MSGCVRGCAWTDQDGAEWPSEAAHGRLCSWCFARLDDHLRWAAPAVGVLRAQVVPDLAAVVLGDRVSGTRDRRLPLRAEFVELADEVFTVVSGWAVEADRLTGIGAPAEVRDAVRADRRPGRLGVVDAGDAAARLRVFSEWMRGHLEAIAYLDCVGVMHDEVVPVVRKAIRMSNVRPRPSVRSEVCPVCGMRRVQVVWVGTQLQGRVECAQCGWAEGR